MANRRKLKNRFLVLLTEKERREERRVPLSEVAAAIKASNNTMTNWVRNKVQKYDTDLVERLCDYFDCDLTDLLYFEIVKDDN